MTAVERQSSSPWLIAYGPDNPDHIAMRLFCFHHAGATAATFRPWRDVVPDGIEIVAVQLPGRDYRFAEPLLTDIRQIVSQLVESLPPLLDKPFVIFGHSLGALIGFDLIRLLRTRGWRQPEMLIASGRNAPQFRWRDAGIQSLPDDEFIAAVRDYNGTPESLLAEASLRELWLPRLRADLTISGMYEYVDQHPLSCPILVMFGDEDSLVSGPGLHAWLGHTTASVRFLRFPGNHFFLHNDAALVLAKLNEELRAQLRHHQPP
jgi:medium-chain acyl-[acyl-carrier-protein] hydrolase